MGILSDLSTVLFWGFEAEGFLGAGTGMAGVASLPFGRISRLGKSDILLPSG